MERKSTNAQLKASKEYAKRNDRINIVFPKGTKERIEALGFKQPITFIKETVLNQIETLERAQKK